MYCPERSRLSFCFSFNLSVVRVKSYWLPLVKKEGGGATELLNTYKHLISALPVLKTLQTERTRAQFLAFFSSV